MARAPTTLLYIHLVITTIYLLILPSVTLAQQTWVQVDDANAAIQYTGSWRQGPCDGCLSPNLANVYNTTWHEARPSRSSGRIGLSFQYYGSSVLVTGFLDNVDPDLNTVVTITLDGTPFTYYYTSANDGTITTGAGIFNRDNVEIGHHTLSVDVEAQSAFFFDFIAYYSAPLPTTTGPTNRVDNGASPTSNANPQTTSSSSPTSGQGATVTDRSPSGSNTGTSSFDPSTVRMVNSTVSVSTSIDSSGNTVLIPITTTGNGTGAATGTSSDYGKAKISAPIAGAIGAAIAVIGVCMIFGCIIWFRKRRKRLGSEKGGVEPYLLVASATSQGSGLHSVPTTPIQPSASASAPFVGVYRNKSLTFNTPDAPGEDTIDTPVTSTFLSPTTASQYPYLLPPDPFSRPTPPNATNVQGESPHSSTSQPLQNLAINTESANASSRHTTVRRGRGLKEPLDFIPLAPEASSRELGEGTGLDVAGGRREDEEANDLEDLPVERPQSLSHPAPPAYSPPRIVRNLGPDDT